MKSAPFSLRHLFSEAQYVLVNRPVIPFAAFFLLILIGRQSSSLLGEYAIVTTFYFVLQVLPLMGLTPYVMREVARSPEKAGALMSTVGLLTQAACVILNLGLLALLHYLPYSHSVKSGIFVVGCAVFPGILAFLAEIILIALHKARAVAYGAAIENGIRLLWSAVLLYRGAEIQELMWVLFATRFFALLFYLHVMRAHYGIRLSLKPDSEILRDTSLVLPVFLMNTLLYLVMTRLDFFMLSLFESVEKVGYYATAYRLLELGMMVWTSCLSALYPRFSKEFSSSGKRYTLLIQRSVRAAFLLLLPLSLLGFAAADKYVFFLFPKQYPHPVLLCEGFLLCFSIFGLDFLMTAFLNAADLQKEDLKAGFWGGLIYASLLLWWVPAYHLYGALFAKAIATLFQLIYRSRLLSRHFKLHLSQSESLWLLGLIFFHGAFVSFFQYKSFYGQFVALGVWLLALYPFWLWKSKTIKHFYALKSLVGKFKNTPNIS